MALGFAVAWYFYITNPLVPFGLAKRFRGAHQFLLNAWYFDALYDALFVRPALRLGRFLWKTGDGTIIDGIGPDGIAARVIDIANRAIKLQTGYIYHYAFVMLIGVALADHLFPVCRRRAQAMSYGWPILSTVTFLPLLGALLILLLRGGDESAFRNARFIALWTTLITFALSLILWRDFDPLTAQFQFVELRPWLGPISFHMGIDGISMPFVLLTTFLMPLCILASWTRDHRAGEGVHDRLPRARDADDRRFHLARPRAVLSVLRGRADPDVPHHRGLGRSSAASMPASSSSSTRSRARF